MQNALALKPHWRGVNRTMWNTRSLEELGSSWNLPALRQAVITHNGMVL